MIDHMADGIVPASIELFQATSCRSTTWIPATSHAGSDRSAGQHGLALDWCNRPVSWNAPLQMVASCSQSHQAPAGAARSGRTRHFTTLLLGESVDAERRCGLNVSDPHSCGNINVWPMCAKLQRGWRVASRQTR